MKIFLIHVELENSIKKAYFYAVIKKNEVKLNFIFNGKYGIHFFSIFYYTFENMLNIFTSFVPN